MSERSTAVPRTASSTSLAAMDAAGSISAGVAPTATTAAATAAAAATSVAPRAAAGRAATSRADQLVQNIFNKVAQIVVQARCAPASAASTSRLAVPPAVRSGSYVARTGAASETDRTPTGSFTSTTSRHGSHPSLAQDSPGATSIPDGSMMMRLAPSAQSAAASTAAPRPVTATAATAASASTPMHRRVNKWFSIETEDLDSVREQLRAWRSGLTRLAAAGPPSAPRQLTVGGSQTPSATAPTAASPPTALYLHIFLDVQSRHPDQRLMVVGDDGSRQPINEATHSSPQTPRKTHVLLETWHLMLHALPGSTPASASASASATPASTTWPGSQSQSGTPSPAMSESQTAAAKADLLDEKLPLVYRSATAFMQSLHAVLSQLPASTLFQALVQVEARQHQYQHQPQAPQPSPSHPRMGSLGTSFRIAEHRQLLPHEAGLEEWHPPGMDVRRAISEMAFTHVPTPRGIFQLHLIYRLNTHFVLDPPAAALASMTTSASASASASATTAAPFAAHEGLAQSLLVGIDNDFFAAPVPPSPPRANRPHARASTSALQPNAPDAAASATAVAPVNASAASASVSASPAVSAATSASISASTTPSAFPSGSGTASASATASISTSASASASHGGRDVFRAARPMSALVQDLRSSQRPLVAAPYGSSAESNTSSLSRRPSAQTATLDRRLSALSLASRHAHDPAAGLFPGTPPSLPFALPASTASLPFADMSAAAAQSRAMVSHLARLNADEMAFLTRSVASLPSAETDSGTDGRGGGSGSGVSPHPPASQSVHHASSYAAAAPTSGRASQTTSGASGSVGSRSHEMDRYMSAPATRRSSSHHDWQTFLTDLSHVPPPFDDLWMPPAKPPSGSPSSFLPLPSPRRTVLDRSTALHAAPSASLELLPGAADAAASPTATSAAMSVAPGRSSSGHGGSLAATTGFMAIPGSGAGRHHRRTTSRQSQSSLASSESLASSLPVSANDGPLPRLADLPFTPTQTLHQFSLAHMDQSASPPALASSGFPTGLGRFHRASSRTSLRHVLTAPQETVSPVESVTADAAEGSALPLPPRDGPPCRRRRSSSSSSSLHDGTPVVMDGIDETPVGGLRPPGVVVTGSQPDLSLSQPASLGPAAGHGSASMSAAMVRSMAPDLGRGPALLTAPGMASGVPPMPLPTTTVTASTAAPSVELYRQLKSKHDQFFTMLQLSAQQSSSSTSSSTTAAAPSTTASHALQHPANLAPERPSALIPHPGTTSRGPIGPPYAQQQQVPIVHASIPGTGARSAAFVPAESAAAASLHMAVDGPLALVARPPWIHAPAASSPGPVGAAPLQPPPPPPIHAAADPGLAPPPPPPYLRRRPGSVTTPASSSLLHGGMNGTARILRTTTTSAASMMATPVAASAAALPGSLPAALGDAMQPLSARHGAHSGHPYAHPHPHPLAHHGHGHHGHHTHGRPDFATDEDDDLLFSMSGLDLG